MSNAPVIDTVGTPVIDTSPTTPAPEASQAPPAPAARQAVPPPANVQQLTVADIISKIHTVLMADGEGDNAGYGLTSQQVNRIEQLAQVQAGEVTWKIGQSAPGNDLFHVLAMYQGEANDQIAETMQGDVRAYLIPKTVVQPGAREYRRHTFSLLMAKTLTHRMTLEQFVEAVAYEELTAATESGIVEAEEEEET